MILGRNPALWLGVIASLLNVAVVVFGVPLTVEGLAAMNGAALAIVGLVANVSDPTALATFAKSVTRPSFMIGSTSGTGSLSGEQTPPTGANSTNAGT